MRSVFNVCMLVLMGALLPVGAVPFTTHLNELSNIVAQAHAASADQPKIQKILGKALNDFEKPSTSVAGDYDIFLAAATHLLPLDRVPEASELAAQTGAASTNAFITFALEAQNGLIAAAARVEALSDFQKPKRAAANQVNHAQRALETVATTSNIQVGLLSLRLAFHKIELANKLAAKAEAKPGFAPESFAGRTLNFTASEDSGTIVFTDESNFTEGDGGGTYTYTRTGLNSARLVLTPESETVTVNLTFKAAGSGVFSAVSVTPVGKFRDKGTFSFPE